MRPNLMYYVVTWWNQSKREFEVFLTLDHAQMFAKKLRERSDARERYSLVPIRIRTQSELEAEAK